MTISSTTRSAGPFLGTGLPVVYPFTFKVFQESDLLVARKDPSGNQTTLALSTDYTVALNADQNVSAGGTVSLLVALPVGYSLTLTSAIPLTQPLSLTNAGAFYPRSIENEFDRLTILLQQANLANNQTLRVPEIGGVSRLPDVATRANKYLGFDVLGNPRGISVPAEASPYVLQKLNETKYAQADFGAVGNGIADDTAAIQAGINSMPKGGVLFLGEGDFRLTSKLSNPKGVLLLGVGPGAVGGLGVVQAGTRLIWDGPLHGTMIECGASGVLSVGGGVRNLMLDGAGGAGKPLRVLNLQRGNFTDMMVCGVDQYGIELTNTAGIITGRCIFENIYINMLDGISDINASGIYINGVNTGGADGTTLCTMRRIAIDHRNGNGVTVSQIGDAFDWYEYQAYRNNGGDTGFGVAFNALRTSGNAICGYHQFFNPIIHGGIFLADVGLHDGTRIANDAQGDIDPSVQRLYGPGAAEVEYSGGYGFSTGGRGLTPDPHRITVRDPMSFIRHDVANDVLHTADRNWRTVLVGSGTVADAGQPGGAVRLTTGTSTNDSVCVFDAASASGGAGWFAANQVNCSLVFNTITITNVVLRIGYFDSNGDTPTNGAYFEADPSVSSFWQIITRKAGTETRANTTLALFVGMLDFSIYLAPAGQSAVFRYRTNGNTFYGVGGVLTTNVPLVGVPCQLRIKTKTTAAAAVDFYSATIGSVQECKPAFGG